MTPRARIVRAGEARLEPLWAPGPSETQWRRVAREKLEATAQAEAILREARAEAEAIRDRAARDAQESMALAAQDARERAEVELAARWLALRQQELKHVEKEADRVIPLAVALAERLLGASLGLEPSRIVDLARTVFDEARGARRAKVDAHPSDASVLREQLTTAGLDVQSVEIREDSALARGELRLQTDVGTIDARLAPRFERLAAALRDALL